MCRIVLVFITLASVPALTPAFGKYIPPTRPPPQACLLPKYPSHGTYVSLGPHTAQPGLSFETAVLNYTCQESYRLIGRNPIFCISAVWSERAPICVKTCKLEKHPSVEYKCSMAEGQRYRACDEYEPSGIIVQPKCRAPDYYSNDTLRPMTCVDGAWDYIATCSISGATATRNERKHTRPIPKACVLPFHPDNGSYEIRGPQPGWATQTVEAAILNYTCDVGYGINGSNQIFCVSGIWSDPLPTCIQSCKLDKHPSVEYKCSTTAGQGYRACDEYEPRGTIVHPECRPPLYYSDDTLRPMTCVDGAWDYIATCSINCGTLPPQSETLIIRGYPDRRSELPWHAGIFNIKFGPYTQICGGTLISNSNVLSAARCFWDFNLNLLRPKETYAVVLGKLYRSYADEYDDYVHRADIKDIHLPPSFVGAAVNYQNDIAVVVMTQSVTYHVNIKPICLNFDSSFESIQLRDGNLAKVQVGGEAENGAFSRPSQVLKVVEVPYIDMETCINQSPALFKPYITEEKICTGFSNDTICNLRDFGTGLTFPYYDKGGVERYYLMGIMSTALLMDDEPCQPSIVTFTRIRAYEKFIKQYI